MFDMLDQWLTGATGMSSASYQQLGLGQPSGDPAQAARSGQSLQYSGPGTAETTDQQALQQQGQAAAGTMSQNQTGGGGLAGLASGAGFGAGFGGG